MKNGLKRLTAMLLLACLLASFVVPATFAGSEEEVVETYDFVLYNAEQDDGYNAMFGSSAFKTMAQTCACGCRKTVKEHVASQYDTLKWKYLENSTGDSKLRFQDSKGWGLQISDEGWTALQIAVPESGSFALQLATSNYQYAGSIQAYIFPASELGSGTVADLMASAISDNDVGTIEILADQNVTEQFNAWNFEAAGDYIVVLNHAIRLVNIGELALIGSREIPETSAPSEDTTGATVPVGTTCAAYDLVLYNAEQDDGYNAIFGSNSFRKMDHICACGCRKTVKEHIASEYDTLKWKYLESSTGDSNLRFQDTKGWGLQISDTSKNGYVALQIAVPESGSFALQLATSNYQYAGSIQAYIFPASEMGSGTVVDLLSSAISDNDVGTIEILADQNVTEQFNAWNFEAAGDYIVVLRYIDLRLVNIGELSLIWAGEIPETSAPSDETTTATETTEATSEETTQATSEETTQATSEETTGTTEPVGNAYAAYDFVLYNADQDDGYNAIFGSSAYKTMAQTCACGCGKTVKEHIASEYDALKWKYLESTAGDSNLRFQGANGWGLQIGDTSRNGWAAFQIAVPESGSFSLQLTTSYFKYAGSIQAYIFPASELGSGTVADLMASDISDNDAGTIQIPKDQIVTKQFNAWNFEAAGDYIVVLKYGLRITYIAGLALTDPVVDEGCTGTYTDLNYNFCLFTEESRKSMFLKDGAMTDLRDNHKCAACGKPIFTCVADQYKAGTLNWTVEGSSFGELAFLADKFKSLRMRFAKDENGEFIMGTDENGEPEKIHTAGNFTAFRIKVGTPGTYNVNIHRNSYGFSTDIYVVPAEKAAYTRAELTAMMTEKNLVGNATLDTETPSLEAGKYNFATAGEYILIMKAAGNTMYIYTTGITLTPLKELKPIPAVKEKVYDFDLCSDDPSLYKKGPLKVYEGKLRVRGLLDQMYAEDKTAWKFEINSTDFGSTGGYFIDGGWQFRSTEKNYRDRGNVWYSFRIKNPGTATYDIRLSVFDDKTLLIADVYLIPVSSQKKLTEEQINEKMTKDNLLVNDVMLQGKDTYYLGEYTFGMEEEYVLVIKLKNGNRLGFSDILMTLDGVKADGVIKKQKVYNGTVYDFSICDVFNGYVDEKTAYFSDVIDQINRRWNSGASNWKWEDNCSRLMGTTAATANIPGTLCRFYRETGMRMYMYPDDWSAFRIKSPGSGTFTLSLNYSASPSSGTLAVYVLPGDTEDIYAAMDHANRVGKVKIYNDGTSGYDKDQSAYLGYWDFEAGKEYIVVIEAYEASPYNSSYSYMNISQLIAERGKIDYSEQEDKEVKPVMAAEDVIVMSEPRMTCLITEIAGHDYYVIPLEAGCGLVYDLDTGELAKEFTHGFSLPDEIIQDENGIVWISGPSPTLTRYDPFTNTVSYAASTSDVPGLSGATGWATMEPGINGEIYLGSRGGCVLAAYNDKTKEYRVVKSDFIEGGEDIWAMKRYGDYLYFAACNKTDHKVVMFKFNILTETVEGSCDISAFFEGWTVQGCYPQSTNILGDGDLIILGAVSGKFDRPVVINPETMELVEVNLPAGVNLYASEPFHGKQYMILGNYGMYHYDLETKEFSKTVGMAAGVGFRSKENQIITLDDQEYLMTYSNTGAAPQLYDFENKEYKAWTDLVRHGNGAAYCRSITNGPEGSNELYFGVYNSNKCAIYNTETGKITGYYKTGGQGDSSLWYEGKLYYGNYSSVTLNEISLEGISLDLEPTNEVIQRWRLPTEETEQKRIHTLAAGDGYVFAGTIPDASLYGGAVVVYDTRTGRWFYERNVVQDQGVIDVEYYDKLLFGSTSTDGGSKALALDPNASAKIFVYDYENKKVLATMDPRDYISGINVPIRYIGGFTADPIVEGRFWAVVSETLFCFSFDKETLKFKVQEVLSFDKNTYSGSASRSTNSREIRINPETKQMYYCFDNNAGIQCFELVDFYAPVGSVKVAKSERLHASWALKYTLSEQGDLYYSVGNGGDLYVLPQNITEEDWEIAEVVDKMILDLGTDITLESEAAIKEARSAYENLSARYQALVQNLDRLLECEVELLERKIDTIVLEDVDADSLPLLQEYSDIYDALNTRQKNYVKNYDHLLNAYNQASILNDKRIAEALQKRINALKDKFPLTLEDEPEVVSIRKDCDAATAPQRVLLDMTILEEAEAQIRVLRAEFVKYTETLIQAIPEEITLEAEPAITAAREAVDKLYLAERKEVSYSKLTSAEGKLRTLKNAKAAAEEVDALIKEIGIVTLGDKERIAAAREAYDKLNETAVAFLEKENKLLRAEFILKGLQTWMIPTIVVADIGIVFAVLWFVPSLHQKVFKGKKKEEETVDG